MARRTPAAKERMQACTTAAAELHRVLELFSRSPEAEQLREAIATQLRAVVTRHAALPRIHSGVPQVELSRLFRDTEMLEAQEPGGFAEYANFLAETVVPNSINMGSLRCFGHMTSIPPGFMHVVADLIGRLNQNVVKSEASRALSLVERQTLGLLHRLVYRRERAFYDEHVQHHDSTLGIVCSGGTLANMTALWCARNACFPPGPGFDSVEESGWAAALRRHDAEGAVILGSERMHYSMQKAASVLGLGSAAALEVCVDAQQRIDLQALEDAIADCRRRRLRIVALVGVAGSTDCGSIDPLAALARIARRERIHFHVDAAWGLGLLCSERHRPSLEGIEQADSVTLDGHKQLYLPIGVGVVLLRDPQAVRSIEKRAPYMLHAGSGDLGRFSMEGSRVGSALLMHASLALIGPHGYGALIERHLAHASQLADMVAASDDFELLQLPQTNIVLYRYVPTRLRAATAGRRLGAEDQCRLNVLNQALQQRQYEGGKSFVSRTTLSSFEAYPDTPIVALRAVVANPLVDVSDMQAMLDDQRCIGAALDAEAGEPPEPCHGQREGSQPGSGPSLTHERHNIWS